MILKTWINGQIINGEGTLGISDLGLTRGFAIFEYLRTYNKVPFKLDTYLKRFQKSVNKLSFNLPIPISEIKKIITEITPTIPNESAIRIILTGGYSSDGFTPSSPNLIISFEEVIRYPQELKEDGIALLPLSYKREIPEIKTTNYMIPLSNIPKLKASKAHDFLYIYNGKVLETSKSNIFFVFDSHIITPQKDVLLGITRETILNLIKLSNHFTYEERDIEAYEIYKSTEAFVTGSSRLVMPVKEIIGYKSYSNSRKVYPYIAKLFNDYIQAGDWLRDN